METIDRKRLWLYLIICFVGTFAVELTFIIPHIHESSMLTIYPISILPGLTMLFPGITAFIVRIITKEGLAKHGIIFDVKHGKGKYYLAAWFLTPILIVLGAFLYFVIFHSHWDYENMAYGVGLYKDAGITITAAELSKTLIGQAIGCVFVGPILNCASVLGDEWGWRGYMLPLLLKKYKPVTAIFLTGLAWGVWNAPLAIAGYNYGQRYATYPFGGIAAMIVFGIVTGMIFGYLTYRTGSVIPAIIAHGSLNTISALGNYFTDHGGDLFIGPSPLGIIGGLPFVILACAVFFLLRKEAKKSIIES